MDILQFSNEELSIALILDDYHKEKGFSADADLTIRLKTSTLNFYCHSGPYYVRASSLRRFHKELVKLTGTGWLNRKTTASFSDGSGELMLTFSEIDENYAVEIELTQHLHEQRYTATHALSLECVADCKEQIGTFLQVMK